MNRNEDLIGQRAYYFISAITGVLLNLVLMLLPSVLVAVPQLVLIDRRLDTFLVIISLWIMLEASASNRIHFQNLQSQARWLPYLASAAMFFVFMSSLTEQAIRGAASFTMPAIIGTIFMLTGVILRYFAIRSLGDYFLDDLAIVPGQILINTGIYRYLRHPSESGNLCIAAGSAFLCASLSGFVIGCCFLLPVVLIRVKLEDELLMRHFPVQFEQYARTVGALLPFHKPFLPVTKTESDFSETA